MPSKARIDKSRRRALMAEEVRLGSPVLEVAKRYKTSPGTVRRSCYEHGVYSPAKTGTGRVYSIVAALLATDRKLTEIAAEHQVSKVYVHRIYRNCLKAGIPVRERPRGRPTKTTKGDADDQTV